MGVRENIKNYFRRIFNQKKVKKLDVPLKERNFLDGPISALTSNKDEQIIVKEIKYYNEVKLINEEAKYLMLAKIDRIIKGKKDKSVLGENVLFEVGQGASIDKVLLEKLVGYYVYEKSKPNNESKICYYIGELNNNPKDYEIVKELKLQKYIDNEISPKLPAPQYQYNRNKSNDFEESLRVNKSKALPSISDNNVFLKQRFLHDGEYEKHYHDYDGTNPNNGTVLRVRKLHKVGKENGRYLYTAFVSKTKSEDDFEKIYSADEDPIGLPVCFTLDGRFEDIVNNQDSNEMKKVLNMLSSSYTFSRDPNKLNYIGNLEKDGRVNIDLALNSRGIINKIIDLQKQFKAKSSYKDKEEEKEIG